MNTGYRCVYLFCFFFLNLYKFQKSAAVHLARHCSGSRAERIFMDWIWWILQLLPFQHLVRVMDCFLHEGIKVSLYFKYILSYIFLMHQHHKF